MNNAAKVLPLLYDSEWYAFLPRHLAKDALSKGRLIEIPLLDGEIPPADYYIIYPENQRQGYELKTFVERIL